jgi:hypothetical protein
MTKQKSNRQTILPTTQRVKLVENVIKHYRELDVNFDSVYKLFGNADSKFLILSGTPSRHIQIRSPS